MSLLKAATGSVVAVGLIGASLFWFAQSGSLAVSEQASVIEYGQLEPAATARREITVMTYNIGYASGLSNNQSVPRPPELFDKNLTSITTLIQEINPDILAVQEIDFDSKRSYRVDQLASIAEQADFSQAARAITWDKHFVPFPPGNPKNYFGRVVSGQAILSKLPIVSHTRRELARPPLPWHRNAFYLDRVIQVNELDVGSSQPLIVIHAHLDHEFPETRRQQLAEVAAVYRQYAASNPVILLGDFNSVPTEADKLYPTDLSLEALLQEPHIAEAFAGQPKEATLTYRADTPDRKLDHIFYNKNFLTLRAATIKTPADHPSDHRALTAQFQLSK